MNQNNEKYSFGEGGPMVFLFLCCACFHQCVCWLPPGSVGETWCWWVSTRAYRSGCEPRGAGGSVGDGWWAQAWICSLRGLLSRYQLSRVPWGRHLGIQGPVRVPPGYTLHWLRALLPSLQGGLLLGVLDILELLLCFPGKGNTPWAVFGVITFPVKTVSKPALISDKEV